MVLASDTAPAFIKPGLFLRYRTVRLLLYLSTWRLLPGVFHIAMERWQYIRVTRP